ncbi:MAG TPA: alpha/beta hydrolase [Gammaproteobacteria bacterium]|jgi:pimeloyl-ACP methyl ester carboxylesterase|nr:alpha/beta hydrolase [Gammaproteobacteria bacterium]
MLRNPYLGPFQRAVLVARHCYLWASSWSHDVFIENPNFNIETKPEHQVSIYCVHGTADRNASFSLISERLKNDLPDHVDGIHLLTFEDRMKGAGIEEFAKQLKDKILSNNKNKRVILMGHSRGGVIASWFAENLAAENDIQVDLVACICAPFRGSYLAKWPMAAISKSVDEMRTDSELVKALSEKIENTKINYIYAGADKDAIVNGDCWLPYHVARVDANCSLHTGHSHLSIMSSHELVKWLSGHIRALYREENIRLSSGMI